MIFLLIFSYLRVSWNGDTLVSACNKSPSGDVKKCDKLNGSTALKL